jgi:hypothetical protein
MVSLPPSFGNGIFATFFWQGLHDTRPYKIVWTDLWTKNMNDILIEHHSIEVDEAIRRMPEKQGSQLLFNIDLLA